MATVYADQVSEMAIIATYAGRPVVNVLHYFNDESTVNDAAKARNILDNWQDHIMGFLSNQYSLQQAVWRSLDRDDLNQGTLAPNAAKRLAGLSAAQGAPPQVAYLVRKVTQNRQRGQRDGRIFLAGVPEDSVGPDGMISNTQVTNITTGINNFLNGVNDGGSAFTGASGLVVLNTTPASREKGPQEVDLTFRKVIGLQIDTKVSTQRDRLR